MGPFHLALGNEEPHGGLGDLEVLAGRGHALSVVSLEQFLGSPPPQDKGQLPGRVLGIVDAGVQTPGTEWRHEVGTVAGQYYPPGLHALGPTAVERVDRLPNDCIVDIRPDDRPNPCVEPARAFLFVEIDIRRHLPVNAKHRARRGVDQYLSAGVPRWVEVEAAFALPPQELGPYVADDKSVVIALARGPNTELSTQLPSGGPSGHDDVASPHRDRTIDGAAGEVHPRLVLADGGDLMTPSLLDEGVVHHLSSVDLLGAGLGDVGER